MTIKPCKECGGPLSDKAAACPGCGAKQKKKISIWVWIGGIFLGLAVIGSCAEDATVDSNILESRALDSNDREAKGNEKIVINNNNWKYDTSKDEMRNTTTKYASNISQNVVSFDFPYNGGSQLSIVLRKTGNDTDIMLMISKGQFLCSIRECEAAFKFDSGNIQSITMAESSSHDSDLLFVAYDKTKQKLINQMKSSQKLTIELPFYQEGNRQFTFNLDGLEWN